MLKYSLLFISSVLIFISCGEIQEAPHHRKPATQEVVDQNIYLMCECVEINKFVSDLIDSVGIELSPIVMEEYQGRIDSCKTFGELLGRKLQSQGNEVVEKFELNLLKNCEAYQQFVIQERKLNE